MSLTATPRTQAQTIDLGNLGGGGFAIEGVAANDYSGRSVSGAGDVNGDGLADLIVGAAQADQGDENYAGTSYVVFGKSSGGTVELGSLGSDGFAIEGAAANDYSGRSVSGAGDVNGDGLADLIVGAPGTGNLVGTSYVVFGKSSGGTVDLGSLGSGGFAIEGAAPFDFSGGSVSGAGDVNGDGLADLIVGAYNADPGNEDRAGTSYVVFGKSSGGTVDLASLGSGGFAIEGAAADHFSGGSVSGAGDVNGDGLADLIVGADGADPGGENYAGTSYVVFGKSDGGTVALGNLGGDGFAIEGVAADDRSGRSVSGAGDVNGDGLADLIVGAFRVDVGGETNAGTSYVVFGKTSSSTVDLGSLSSGGFAIEGAAAGDRSGLSVSGVGDVNGDGLADLIVGAYRAAPDGEVNAGTSYVVFGKSSDGTVDLGSLGSGGFAIKGAAAGDFSGGSVSGAGDVNGDGLADLVVGASASNGFAGTSYVVFSTASPELTATYRTFMRNGDAPRQAVGVSGDGSNDDSPDARVWMDFDDGFDFVNLGTDASSHEVTLNRGSGAFGDSAAEVHWQLQTNRGAWSGAELTFRYIDAELLTADESALLMVHAPAADGPYTVLPSIVNPIDNTISVIVDELGFFFVTEAPGEIDVQGNGNAIADGDTTPRATDNTDFGKVLVGSSPVSRTFTIRNEGTGMLTLTDDITVPGAGFSVVQPASDSIPPGNAVTFEVSFDTEIIGVTAALVNIPNDDDDENPYTFAVRANAVEDLDIIFADGFE
ncbi:MAG: choice-of-anchor D domain-containing protein [Pseudomonadota bacterium]